MAKRKSRDPITFTAVLRRPAEPEHADWAFLRLPAAASEALPSRGTVGVEGTLAGARLHAPLPPDGQGGHWLKVDAALLAAGGVGPGDTVEVVVAPAADEPEPEVPDDLAAALAATTADVRAAWTGLKAAHRRDWIDWIVLAKRAETRAKRIAAAMDMLAHGKRKVCCFDRSGIYGGGFAAPEAAAD
ncbi:YdeI/OmpD-associated family protein [Arenimonas composti]|uniref:DUF1905 domain-containing protein n=1 Tax=Arenimonas composti TR7-09 = DSM 18010 TaxID=1121013 RepID=A0A091B9D9_9GAMM|nr:YdeI/OmpD-associated family protein [Arenimonas composti]KFN49278.1 hypothetical protein P873_11570 [Arenimonas composti TR7-09 = DSM 18010]